MSNNRVLAANDALREFRNASELFFHRLRFWESLSTLEKNLKAQITFRFDDELFKWSTCVVTGSRARGLEHKDSDLNVIFFYKGDVDEEELAELLAERPLQHDKVLVSVTPVRVWGDGSRIVQVLSAEEEYLAMRKAAYLTEVAMHDYYQRSLQNILNRPRNLMVRMIVEELQGGNSQLFVKELERIGCDDKSLKNMLAAYESGNTSKKVVSFGRVA